MKHHSPELKAGSLRRAAWFVGFVALGLFVGYMSFGRSKIQAHDHGVPTSPVELPVQDQPELAGLYCPGDDFALGVQDCHCPAAHAMKSVARQRLSQSWTADASRAELVDLSGPSLLGKEAPAGNAD